MRCATTRSGSSSSATTRSACATSSFIIAGFFAGIAGGLAALNFEIVDRRGRQREPLRRVPAVHLPRRRHLLLRPDHRRGADGAGLRAAVRVHQGLAALPGLVFMLMVMYAPGGIASLIMMNLRVAAYGRLRRLLAWLRWRWRSRRWWRCSARRRMIEMVYHLQLDAAHGPMLQVPRRARWTPAARRQLARCAAGRAARRGAVRIVRRRFARHWGAMHSEIRRPRARSAGEARISPQGEDRKPRWTRSAACEWQPAAACALGTEGPAQELSARPRSSAAPTWRCAPGERVAIIGPNGAGKSTLFNLISGRFGATSGEILLERPAHRRLQAVRDQPPRACRAASRSPTSSRRLSVFENLRCGVLWSLGYRYAFWKFLADLQRCATSAPSSCCAMISLDRKRDTLAMNLTYAEQRALEIGITIAGGADVILLDEPTAGMSQSETDALHRADPRGDGRQDAADGRARHGRGVRPGRQDRGAGLRRGHRLRHAGRGARQPRCRRPISARCADAQRRMKPGDD